MMKRIKTILAIAIIVLSVSELQAQPGGVPGGGGAGGGTGSNNGGAPGVPFDGGLSVVLVAAGSAIAAKKRKKTVATKAEL
jgi:hypothetical protein